MKNLYLFFLLASFSTHSQLSWNGNSYSLESSLFISSDSTLPFWMRSQTYGEVPVASQFLQLKGCMHHEYDSTYSLDKRLQKFGLGYGISTVANVGKVNQFIFSQGYLKARYGIFELWAGRRKETIGLVDSTLSSGSLIWGGNALPLPKVQFEIPNYVPIVGKGLVSIKGTYAHGWFGSTDLVKNYLLHQKTFYTRFGRPNWKFKFYAGFNHQVQWGGRPSIPYYDNNTEQLITKFPGDLLSYIKVISGVSVNRNGDQELGTNGVPYTEAFNRIGNHLGTFDIGLRYESEGRSLIIYRQSIYEDGSLFYLNNINDGLVGLSFSFQKDKAKLIQIYKVGIEYLNTINQGGELGANKGFQIQQLRGRDNYFNNSIYIDGWTYKGNVISSPFYEMLPNTSIGLNNNRIEVFSFSAVGVLNLTNNPIEYRLNVARYSSIGTYTIKIERINTNASQLCLKSKIGDFEVILNFAVDVNQKSNFGTQIGLKYGW